MKKNILAILGIIFILGGALGGVYVGGYCMFIKPIIEACLAFNAGTLTGLMLGITALKCAFATTIGTLIAMAGYIIGVTLIYKE